MHFRTLTKAGISLLLASIVGLSLWLASPQGASALTVNISTPAGVNVGQTYSFSATVTIDSQDVYPITSASLQILNSSNSPILTCGLPVEAGTANYTDAQTGNGAITITATTNGWNYGYGDRLGYWDGLPPQHYGYGYGWGTPGGSIAYNISWTTPSSITPGDYRIQITINSDLVKTGDSTFTLSQQTSGGFGGGGGMGGGGGGGPTGPGITNLTIYTNDAGTFVLECIAYSDDKLASLYFPKGVAALQKDGSRLKSISITPMDPTPPAPKGSNIYGLAYEFGPEGATFEPPITLTLSYDPADLPAGFNPQNLTVALWNAETDKWEVQEGAVIDANAHTINLQIGHFSAYTIVGTSKPASISVQSISLSPAEANVGDEITVSARVANSGDLPGDYTVTFKVNGTTEGTQKVTLDGNSSTTVSFTITPAEAGDYEIDINGKSQTLSIVATALPGEFSLRSLAVFPSEVNFGEDAIISIIAQNNGDEPVSSTVIFKIDGVVVHSEVVNLAPHTSETVEFTTSNSEPGLRTVDVNGQETTFNVKPLVEAKTTGAINWYLIGILIFIVTAVTSVVGFRLRDRSRYIPPVPPRKP